MKGNRGFSMIELMIAAAIFAFGMLAIAGMSYTSVYLVSSSNGRFAATTIAEEVIEQARNHDQSWILSKNGEETYFDEMGNQLQSDTSSTGIVFTRKISANSSGNGVLVRVKVTWKERGEMKNVIQSALIF